MPLYDSLLLRLQSLPISATSLNALVPLLTAAFSHIPPPALGPAAFRRFFYAVHARLAAPSDAYSDELRVCIDACVRGYGGEWPSGMVPLSSSSQTQTPFQSEARLSIEVSASPASCAHVAEQVPIPYIRSIEVIGCAHIMEFALKKSPEARNYPGLPMCHFEHTVVCLVASKNDPRTCPRIATIRGFHISLCSNTSHSNTHCVQPVERKSQIT
jgi:hypothetical protein